MRKKGEVRKLCIRPLTIDDILIKDGLEAVSTLTEKEPYYIVGGIATQSYLPSKCRRPTSDIDISIVRSLNYEEFKSISKPVVEYLLDNKYNVQTKKNSRYFNLDVTDKNEERLIIEFSRRNKKSFEFSRKKLEREIEHSKRKILENTKSTYTVAAAEDIIVPKLARSANSLVRHPEFDKFISKEMKSLTEEEVKKNLDYIWNIRENAMLTPGDLDLAEELKFISDLYDIRILSELAGINTNYFYESSKDWNVLSRRNDSNYKLFNFLLPQFNVLCNKNH